MRIFGYSGNLMSLGALDFGLIVDASIVMVENFIRRLELRPNGDRIPLFRQAAHEVGRPILFGIAIIVAVYIPIFTLDGMEGRMFIPMAFTVVCAVLGSLLLALTYVPAAAALFLHHAPEKPSRFQELLRTRYRSALDWAMHHARPVVTVSVIAILAALGSLSFIGTEFMPELDEGSILVETIRIPSISLDEANRLSLAAEQILLEFPEVVTAVTKEGRPDLATEAMGLFEGDIYVILKPKKEWTTAKTHEGLVEAFDSALAVIPGLLVIFSQPLADRLDEAESGIRTDLGVKVVGPDLDENRRIAEQIRKILASVRGAADVGVQVSEGTGQLTLDIRRDALARYGLSVGDVQETLELAVGARAATEMVVGPRRIDVLARYPDEIRGDPQALRGLTIRAPGGELVPLAAVADISFGTGPELIAHENGQRYIVAFSNVRGRDLGGFVQEVRSRIQSEVNLPAGVFLEWGGQYENQQRAMERLKLVVPLAVLLIFVLLYAAFHSVAQSLLVLSNVPFALVGGVSMLWLRGLNLSLSASIGFIALFGIAVLNGVVLVTHLNDVRKQTDDLDEAVRTGSTDRLRPVLMTALVASLGFVPMALSTSPGSEIQRPLASVVIGGLITSTVLTLFVLPTLYYWLTQWQMARAGERRRGAEAAVAGARREEEEVALQPG
jgi:cobalt-zinc-cadmium resistance protein CzcA